MEIDIFIFQQINDLVGKFDWLDNTAIFFAEYLEYVLAGLAVLILWKKGRVLVKVFAAAVLARYAVVEIIRLFFARPRPFIAENVNLLVEASSKGSFPSGHAAFFFALSAVIYFYNKKAGLFFFIASCLMGISRIFVGLHWPSDILAGALIGILTGWLITRIFRK